MTETPAPPVTVRKRRRRNQHNGARTDAYRQVWCLVYSMDEGELVTVSVCERKLAARFPDGLAHNTVRRAIEAAESAGLVVRKAKGGKPCAECGSTAIRWARAKLPKVLTVERLRCNGATWPMATGILEALESGGYVRLDPRGFVPV